MEPRRPKVVIQMSGAPGSGKSTLAKKLRPSLNGIIIDHDVLRSCLLSNSSTSFEDAAKQAYSLQWALADDFLSQGVNALIIDSTCNYKEALEHGLSLASRYSYTYWYIECKTEDVQLLDQRLRMRVCMPSQRRAIDCPPPAACKNGARAKEDARALFDQWINHPVRPDESRVIQVDSTAGPDALRDYVLGRIQA